MNDEILELLIDLEQYMDKYADVVDGECGWPVSNEEMIFLGRIRDMIPKIEKL